MLPRERIWIYYPVRAVDPTGSPEGGWHEPVAVLGIRRDLAGRRDSSGELVGTELTVQWRFPRDGLEDMPADAAIGDDAGNWYLVTALLRDRQYPTRYWEARCSASDVRGSTRPSERPRA